MAQIPDGSPWTSVDPWDVCKNLSPLHRPSETHGNGLKWTYQPSKCQKPAKNPNQTALCHGFLNAECFARLQIPVTKRSQCFEPPKETNDFLRSLTWRKWPSRSEQIWFAVEPGSIVDGCGNRCQLVARQSQGVSSQKSDEEWIIFDRVWPTLWQVGLSKATKQVFLAAEDDRSSKLRQFFSQKT